MKSSKLGRSLELAKMVAQVGFKELRSGNMKSRFDQAVLIANSLSKLKGAAMKAGQILSLDLNHYFPPEAIEILSQLQNAAIAQPFESIEAILKSELGENKFSKIENLIPTPLGVASIGQVHRARLDGRDMVFKVQYPGVADSIDSDLKILKTIASSFCQITGRRMNLEPLFKEFRTLLEQELDYKKEAQFQKEYRSLIAGISTAPDFSYLVPEIIDEMSTERVLAMSYESGKTLRQWISEKHPMKEREVLAYAILDLYFHEFFEWGLVQTDPNWANFFVDENGAQTNLVVLDFGATRKYSGEFIQNYIQLLQFTADKKSVELRKHAIEFGLIDPRESAAAFEAFEAMLTTAIRPFFAVDLDSTHFDFSNQDHSLNSQQTAKNLADELVYSPPPYSLVFLHRKLAGVYSILKALGVQLDVSSYWNKMTQLASQKKQL